MDIINLYENYDSYFDSNAKKHLKPVLEKLSKAADKCGCKLFLIGGIVRDMLLDVNSTDIDITVEGDAIEFAKCLEKENIAKISSVHEDFGTVKVIIDGQKIDLASTRSESYPHAGHLPVVEKIGCGLKEDVLRRDFTINALAMSLNKETFGDLIDFVGGFEDLKSKKIRILHDKSFIDDPTRIIRGLKYATRLNFKLKETTRKLQEAYLENINYDLCYKRIKQEFVKTFSDANSIVFQEFLRQGLYNLVIPNAEKIRHAELVSASCQLSVPDKSRNEFAMALGKNIEFLIKKYNPQSTWIIWMGALFELSDLNNFDFTKYEKDVLQGAELLMDKTFDNNFELYKAYKAQKLETLLIIAALGKEKEVFKYLDELQNIKLQINGQDLIELGHKPSKKFSEALDAVLKRKIEQLPEALTKQDELTIAKKFLN